MTKAKSFLTRLTIALACMVFPTPLMAQEKGAFGVQMGEQLSKYKIKKNLKPNLYKVKEVPKPDKDFPTYVVRYHEDTGICLVLAAGWPIITNSEGDELKAAFDVKVEELSKRFGKAKTSFYVTNGSTVLWKKHFMSKLVKNEAVLAARWRYEIGSTMDKQVMEVLLLAKGANYEEGSFDLQFKFNNYGRCLKALKKDAETTDQP